MPVLETLGGALSGAVLQVLLDKLDSHKVVDYFRGRKLDEKLLKYLRRKLVSINAVVDDAELKQFVDTYVKSWLDEVRDVLFDAEDLLEEIGMKIVEKCNGLPLGLETLGCLLHTKSFASEWQGVVRSEIWDLPIEDSKIIPALLLSYYHLPSHLKRCFAFCALFPKDHKFDKESLILLWMAQNFLQCSQPSKSPEEVGEHYFNDLLSRSFFQPSLIYNYPCFVMHDLLNDLAKYVSGEMCFRLGVDRAERVPKTIRPFSTVIDPVRCHKSLCDAKGLRTFISIRGGCGMSLQELISNFKFLRLLSLPWCCNIKEMSDSIGNLIHLRSLDLSNTKVKEVSDTLGNLIYLCSLDLSGTRIERLPNSTYLPCNLQVLKLNKCLYLKELPSTLHELTNLCRLELVGTTLRKAPLHLGKLENLQLWMDRFEVGKSNESIIQLGEIDLLESCQSEMSKIL